MTSTDAPSRATSRRNFLVGGLGLACAGFALVGARETAIEPLPENTLPRLLPERLGPWQSSTGNGVIVPPESELSDRTYNEVLVRIYNGPADAVALCLAYGAAQSRDMQLHRPEVCYPAAGFAVVSSRPVQLELPGRPPISATLLDTQSNVRKEQVLYWTRIGSEFPTAPLQQRLAVVTQNLRGRVPDGMLVRASTVAEGPEAAYPVLSGFLAAMVENSPPRARELLLGSA